MKSKPKRASVDDTPAIFNIDLLQLDKEWVEQPRLYFGYAVRLADARLEFEQSKTALDVVIAEVDSDIRQRPKRFGLKTITEAAIKAAIRTVKAYADAESEAHKLRHKVDILQATVTALDHRKKALENLVALHGQQYFSEPREPAGGKELISSMRKKSARRPLDYDDD